MCASPVVCGHLYVVMVICICFLSWLLVMKFDRAVVNGGSNDDFLEVAKCLVMSTVSSSETTAKGMGFGFPARIGGSFGAREMPLLCM